MELNTGMSEMTFLTISALVLAIIFSPAVVTNAFAKPSSGDSSNGGGSPSDDKSKTSSHTSGHKKGGGMPVPVAQLYGLIINTKNKRIMVTVVLLLFQGYR